MTLTIFPTFSLFPPKPHNPSSSLSFSSSSLTFLFNPSPKIKSPKPPFSSPTPIFLPLLEQTHQNPTINEDDQASEDDLVEEELDPIRAFFKFRTQTQDPNQEGRISLQRNRRSSWHIADTQTNHPESETHIPFPENPKPELTSHEVGGVVGEILWIARNLPQNGTLGEELDGFVGRIGKSECVELLVRMGEEGLVWECLYLFEWMRLQEPSLVTPRACSVLFVVLGKARMGEKVMVLFENLPGTKEFRDVRVYNAAISGLAACRR